MPIKAGITDSGSATADTKVARQSRKNSQTTATASNAPSISRCREPVYSSCTGLTKLKASVSTTSGCWTLSSTSACCTAAPTATSLSPRLRDTSKPTTVLPLSKAAERCSAVVSLTVATWSSRMRRPLLKASCNWLNSCADFTVASVRTGCSPPPTSVRPPALSSCTWRNWREISAAVAPSACNLSGSSAMRTSRVTPPTRVTAPTPRTASSARVTSLSTNQDRASSSSLRESRPPESAVLMVNASTGWAAMSSLLTIGSRTSPGRSLRTRATAERTSSTASCTGFSRRNSAVMVTPPSWTLV